MSAILRIALPLTLWLAGFSAVYALHGLVCSGGWPGGRPLLIAGGAAVLALQLALLLALRSRRFGDPTPFVRRTSLLPRHRGACSDPLDPDPGGRYLDLSAARLKNFGYFSLSRDEGAARLRISGKMRETDEILAELTPLRRYARSLTRDEAEAEDLVQEALLRAHERRASFRRGKGLRVWLMSILHNLFIDALRSRRARERREAAAMEAAPLSHPASQESAVRLAQIREAFARLPEEQRSALHLVAIEGLSYAEAAEGARRAAGHAHVADRPGACGAPGLRERRGGAPAASGGGRTRCGRCMSR